MILPTSPLSSLPYWPYRKSGPGKATYSGQFSVKIKFALTLWLDHALQKVTRRKWKSFLAADASSSF
ncbi:hypothetical protein AVEN_202638-1, partial [Araneus ventricosus]